MQLLRDNLTLWTSSDGNDAEGATEAKEETKEAPAAEGTTETKPAEEEAKPEAAA